jgi:hypothetical protein
MFRFTYRLRTLLIVSAIGLAIFATMFAVTWASYSYINNLPPIEPIQVPTPPGV